ncbi:unnamed protein product [Lasius platythorax]|uniref:Uncharacterized protein n=1 Tax=Lasius platythorax TaxID=488582 RepID=A0AAV2NC67_9HYME
MVTNSLTARRRLSAPFASRKAIRRTVPTLLAAADPQPSRRHFRRSETNDDKDTAVQPQPLRGCARSAHADGAGAKVGSCDHF